MDSSTNDNKKELAKLDLSKDYPYCNKEIHHLGLSVTTRDWNFEMITRWLTKNGYVVSHSEYTGGRANIVGWQCYYTVAGSNRMRLKPGKYEIGNDDDCFSSYGKATRVGMEYLLGLMEGHLSKRQ